MESPRQTTDKVTRPTYIEPSSLSKSKSSFLRIVTFNCKNIKTCAQTFHDLLKEGDIFLVQEHWLFDYELSLLDELHSDITGIGKSVDSGNPIPPTHRTRGYGGVAVLWNKNIDKIVRPIPDGGYRIQCVEVRTANQVLLVSIYCSTKIP